VVTFQHLHPSGQEVKAKGRSFDENRPKQILDHFQQAKASAKSAEANLSRI